MTKIELLAPAGTAAIGRAAIDAGADAVYIGAERFGAREAAGNSMQDIAELVGYAHAFGARIYLTLNTLLFENELTAAERTAWEAYEAGVDALIVQDMAFTQMNLPPVALHASTQTFNATPERVRFLAKAGFSRIVLERGLSLHEIRAIRAALPAEMELEAFVHGAICVSYSGQCYLGHALCGRGGNRGGCAQPCRSQYNLITDNGNILARNKHLLSVSDLNLSDRLDQLVEAEVCSLKIEGRLKDESYVVNNTAYYHQRLHDLGVERCSTGVVTADFTPNPEKSFSRGFSTYFWDGKRAGVLAPEAKSVGEFVGTVNGVRDNTVTLNLQPGITIHNGDGICFLAPDGKLKGTNVNRADGNRIMLNKCDSFHVGAKVYRNSDRSFRPCATRKIEASVVLTPTCIQITDATGIQAEVAFDPTAYTPATNGELAAKNIRNALSKGGDTIFRIRNVSLDFPKSEPLPFIPAAKLNALRRELLEYLLQARLDAYEQPEPYRKPTESPQAPDFQADYRANIANSMAERFYREAGFSSIEQALEVAPLSGATLVGREVMRTPYCIRRERGTCLKQHPELKNEKLFLENNGVMLELTFNCMRCEMGVIYRGHGSKP